MLENIEDKKTMAQAWFKELSDTICHIFEKHETELIGADDKALGKFTRTPWQKSEGREGGGIMSMLKGRVYEKAAVHISTTYGEFSDDFRSEIPGAQDDPRYWASGISVISHPWNPFIPSAHFNTRMIVTTKQWFGGGADLTPMVTSQRDKNSTIAEAFHDAMKYSCDKYPDIANYEEMSKSCDDYFYLPHRHKARGIGGIFYDYLHSSKEKGGWHSDFSFTKEVGINFARIYNHIVRCNLHAEWNRQDREEQLNYRGLYTEFNLLYDRGTRFGLQTGGNIDSILSSLPPMVSFP